MQATQMNGFNFASPPEFFCCWGNWPAKAPPITVISLGYTRIGSKFYFRSSKNPITLDQLPAKCKNIANVPVIEQKILFLLLAYENEALRTEVNFITEEQKFEELEQLNHRARFLASVHFECLPTFFTDDQRKIMVADYLEPISKSSEEDNEAGELDKAEEVLSVVLPADEDATLPLYPGEEALDEPAPLVTA